MKTLVKSTLRPIHPSESAALSAMATETFIETFGHNYSAEDLAQYKRERLSPKALGDELADPANRFFWMQTAPDAAPLGYLKCTLNCTKFLEDLNAGVSAPQWPLYLERFYLLKSAHGTGLAHAAMQDFFVWVAANTSADAVHLTVWEENPRAQRFYQRYGFAHVGDTLYPVGDQLDHEYLYLKRLDG